MVESSCPDEHTLGQLLCGKLDGPEVGELEEHFADCPHCVKHAERLSAEDTLVAAFSGADTTPDVLDDERYRQLRQNLLAMYHQRMDESVEATLSDSAIVSTEESLHDFAALLSPPNEPDDIGRIGTFRVVELLGKGGMGIVLRAIDERLQRSVALKVMKPNVAGDPTSKERFLREARAAAAIDHDHVVTIHQVGEENEVPFIAMQLLSGESLDGRLKRVERLPVDESLRIAREAAAGLSAAHQQGLLHRDVKPDNIWLEEGTDRVKILDFGLARAVESDGELTGEGAVVGTVNYMSPEQVQGRQIDERCDQFSLGSVLYRMLSGRIPFKRETLLSTMHATASDSQEDLQTISPEIPPSVAVLVNRLLEKEPEKRFASADDVCREIAHIETELSQSAPVTSARPTRRLPGRRLIAVAASVVALLLLSVIIYVATDHGTLIVKADDKFATSLLQGREITIRNKETNREFRVLIGKERLPSGEYWISVKDNQGLRFSTSRFSIMRGGKEELVVTIEPSKGGVIPSPPSGASGRPPTLGSIHPLPKGARSSMIETRLHRGEVYDLATSPDGKLLATAGVDGTVRLWTTEPFELHSILLRHGDQVRSLAWSPDGKTLASGGLDGSVVLWNISQPRVSADLQIGHPVRQLAWSRDGEFLAFVSLDGETRRTVQVWAATDQGDRWKRMHEFKNCDAYYWPAKKALIGLRRTRQTIYEVRQMLSGRLMARHESAVPNLSADWKLGAVINGKLVRLVDAETKETRVELPEFSENIVAVSWSPDSQFLATISGNKPQESVHVQFWQAADGARINAHDLKPIHWGSHPSRNNTRLRWTADNRRLLVWTPEPRGGKVSIIGTQADVSETHLLNYGIAQGAGLHGARIRAFPWKPDGSRIAIQSLERHAGIALLDPTTGIRHESFNVAPRGVIWSADGKHAFVVQDSSGIAVIDVAKGDATRKEVEARVQTDMRWLSASQDGKSHVFHRGRTFRFVSLPENRTISEFEAQVYKDSWDLRGWLSHNGARLATSRSDQNGDYLREVHVWDVKSGKLQRTLAGFEKPVKGFLWSHDDQLIATLCVDRTIRLWDTTTGQQVKSLSDPKDPLADFSWVPGKRQMAVVTRSGKCRFWDFETSQFGFSFEVNPTGCGNPVFSPDGNTLMFTTAHGTVQLHSAQDGQQMGTFYSLKGDVGPLVLVGRKGHFRIIGGSHGFTLAVGGSPESQFVYVVERNDGQQLLLDRTEMNSEYGWLNDSSQIQMIPRPGDPNVPPQK